MAEAAMVQEEINVPEGGIADFVMDDAEVDAAYGPEEEEVPAGGIGQFDDVIAEMAAMGREGDDVIAHLQTGELVIPAKLLEDNPDMKETIFAFLEGQGIEDPQRYVVGSDANSINPDTGAAEFFFKFLKKVVKKVVKGVKKVVKAVVKVVKKIAPVVLPIVGSLFFGPVFGAALGSGIATLINGGSIKDALKSGLISGVTGGVMAGVGGAMSGAGFGAGVKAAVNPANISAGVGALKTGFTEGFGQAGIGFNSMKYGIAGSEQISANLAEQAAAAAATPGAIAATPGTNAPALTSPTNEVVQQAAADTALQGSGGFKANIVDAFTPGGKSFGASIKDAFLPSSPSAGDFLAQEGLTPITATQTQLAGAKLMAQEAAPGFLAKYGPLAAAGTAVAAGTGMFTVPEQESPGLIQVDEEGNPITGENLITDNPENYLVGDLGDTVFDPATGQYVRRNLYDPSYNVNTAAAPISSSPYTVPTNYQFNRTGPAISQAAGPFARPQMYAAEGGEVYPRRNGGIMPNEGVPNQDSVRAMLMPGEFVMTTDAVAGLGGGDLNRGIANMYSVMRNLEKRGRAAV